MRKPRKERIREILITGKELLFQKGFSFTAKQIALKIGITETMVFHIFPSKKHIINAIYEDHFNSIKPVESLPRTMDGKNIKSDLIEYFISFYRHAERTRTFELLYLYALEKSEYKPQAKHFQKITSHLSKGLENYFELGIKNGFFSKTSPAVMTEMIHNVFFHLVFFNVILLQKKITDEELRKKTGDFIELFLNAAICRLNKDCLEKYTYLKNKYTNE